MFQFSVCTLGRFVTTYVFMCVLRLMLVFQLGHCVYVCVRMCVILSPQTSKNKARSVRSHLATMEPHGTLPFTSNQPHTERSG